jgi:hypothetical protein
MKILALLLLLTIFGAASAEMNDGTQVEASSRKLFVLFGSQTCMQNWKVT